MLNHTIASREGRVPDVRIGMMNFRPFGRFLVNTSAFGSPGRAGNNALRIDGPQCHAAVSRQNVHTAHDGTGTHLTS